MSGSSTSPGEGLSVIRSVDRCHWFYSASEARDCLPPPMRRMASALCLGLHLFGCTCHPTPAEPLERAPTSAELATFVRSSNELGWGLYDRLADDDQPNLLVSPAGVALALTILEAGSAGATRDELLAVLNDGDPDEEGLQLAAGGALDLAGLTSASHLIVAEGLDVGDPFRRAVRRRLGARVVVADPSGPSSGSDRIRPADLAPTARAAVVTRLRFGGRWVHPLVSRLVSPSAFVRLDGERVFVPTMWLRARLRCARVAGMTVVELPYEGNRFSMLLARPEPQAQLDVSAATTNAWLEALESSDVELSLPRFAFGPQRHRLKAALAELGVEQAFDPERADLSRLANTEPPLSVDSVVQNARIEVDEYGTRAEATTVASLADSASEPPQLSVRFDRPFFFLLRDDETGLIAFLGRVGDPQARDTPTRTP